MGSPRLATPSSKLDDASSEVTCCFSTFLRIHTICSVLGPDHELFAIGKKALAVAKSDVVSGHRKGPVLIKPFSHRGLGKWPKFLRRKLQKQPEPGQIKMKPGLP